MCAVGASGGGVLILPSPGVFAQTSAEPGVEAPWQRRRLLVEESSLVPTIQRLLLLVDAPCSESPARCQSVPPFRSPDVDPIGSSYVRRFPLDVRERKEFVNSAPTSGGGGAILRA